MIMTVEDKAVKLEDRDGKVMARLGGADPVPVRIVYARPVTGPGADVWILNEKGETLASVGDLSGLDADSRMVAELALKQHYFLPRIIRVLSAEVEFGQRTIKVETDRGPRAFALKNVNRNVLRLGEDRVIIRDTAGNRYEIRSLAALDDTSRDCLRMII